MLFERALLEGHVFEVKLRPCGSRKGAAAERDVDHAAISDRGVVEKQTIIECHARKKPRNFAVFFLDGGIEEHRLRELAAFQRLTITLWSLGR